MTMLTRALTALAGIGAFSTFVLAYAGGPSLPLIAFDAGLASVFTVTFTRAVITTSAQPPEVYAAYEEGLRDGSKPGRRDLHMPVGAALGAAPTETSVLAGQVEPAAGADPIEEDPPLVRGELGDRPLHIWTVTGRRRPGDLYQAIPQPRPDASRGLRLLRLTPVLCQAFAGQHVQTPRGSHQ